MISPSLSSRRTVIYLAALIFPPVMIGTLIAFGSLSSTLLHKTPTPIETRAEAITPPPLTGKLKAALLLSNDGTQITEVFGPYQILAESGMFDVFTVAPQRTLSPTTGAIDILPHYSLESSPKPDLLVIPAVMNPKNPELIEWIKKTAAHSKLVLSLCEGARLAVEAQLFHGLKGTSHFLALSDLQRAEPSAEWIRGVRYIESGKIISSSGVTASLDATFYAIEKLSGKAVAQATANRLGHLWTQVEPQHELRALEFFPLFFRSAFDWMKGRVGILLSDGMAEISLASLLDTFPRAQDDSLFTTGPTRKVYRTANGLDLVPTESVGEMLPADVLFVAKNIESSGSMKDSTVLQWIRERKVQVQIYGESLPGQAYDQSLSLLAQRQGPLITDFAAKMMNYPKTPAWTQTQNTAQNWPISLWIKPLLIALFSLGIAIWAERRFRKHHSNF